MQNKQRELDALKTRNEALMLQVQEAQERYKKEEEELKVRTRLHRCSFCTFAISDIPLNHDSGSYRGA